MFMEKQTTLAALARGAAINPVFEKIVRDDGTIFYPNAGIIDVNNKTMKIRLLLTEVYHVFNNPQVDVSVSNLSQKSYYFWKFC